MLKSCCRNELGLQVEMLSSKRIGRQVANKPRNLLEYVQSSQQAQKVIGLAKMLRRSKILLHTSVFVNFKLTKAEAKAQYEIRQKRRQINSERRETATVPVTGVSRAAEGIQRTAGANNDRSRRLPDE